VHRTSICDAASLNPKGSPVKQPTPPSRANHGGSVFSCNLSMSLVDRTRRWQRPRYAALARLCDGAPRMKVMIPEQEPSCEFRPGDHVQAIDGTFVGLRGRVIGVKVAQELWTSSGGRQPSSHTLAACVWAALSIFSRPVPVMLVRDQIRHITA
jgi:hypothetical protein